MRELKSVEAVWRERAERLSRREVSAGAAQNAVPVLVLGIAKERYGIDLPDVAEVLPPRAPRRFPERRRYLRESSTCMARFGR